MFGLGYDPKKFIPENDRHTFKEPVKPEQEVVNRGGFGVGVFEDEDDDVYDFGPSKVGYSTVLMDEEEELSIIQKEKEIKKAELKELELKDSKIVGFDGRSALTGFMFAVDIVIKPDWYYIFLLIMKGLNRLNCQRLGNQKFHLNLPMYLSLNQMQN